MADDLLDFLPLFPEETEDTILARMRAWANEGLDPDQDVDQWVDTSEGSHWFVCTMPAVREAARLYDLAGTEVPASGFPVWAWADYLDDHGEVQDIVRLPATAAVGEVTFGGAAGTVIPSNFGVGVEPVSPDDGAPEYEVITGDTIGVSGELTLAIRATEAGVIGNVAAGAVTEFSTAPPDPAMTVVNTAAIRGGSEAETDDALRERVLGAYQGEGAGNKRDYERWARAWAGVGRVTVIPLWNGPGTVKVIVTDADGQPLPAPTIADLQADLDPDPGKAEGRAPVGAEVTVETAAALPLTVAATVECEPGYSLDGFGGTVDISPAIRTALRNYAERVESGGEVVYSKIGGLIATVGGVHDVGDVLLNGGTANVPVDDDPAQVPTLDDADIDLTEGVV